MLNRLKQYYWRRAPLQTLSSVAAYAQWAQDYPANAHNPLMEVEQAAMVELMPALAGRVVLDLACGTGRYGLYAQSHGARFVFGVDNSFDMLKSGELALTAQATTESLPLASESIDVILCGLALGHLPKLLPSMREIRRVLKPGGVALMSDFHPFLALNGAKRTFTGLDGRTYSVEHYVHLYSDYHQAAASVGLQIAAVVEHTLPETSNSRNRRVPVVIVYRMTPC